MDGWVIFPGRYAHRIGHLPIKKSGETLVSELGELPADTRPATHCVKPTFALVVIGRKAALLGN